jgi:hypothetical protein
MRTYFHAAVGAGFLTCLIQAGHQSWCGLRVGAIGYQHFRAVDEPCAGSLLRHPEPVPDHRPRQPDRTALPHEVVEQLMRLAPPEPITARSYRIVRPFPLRDAMAYHRTDSLSRTSRCEPHIRSPAYDART